MHALARSLAPKGLFQPTLHIRNYFKTPPVSIFQKNAPLIENTSNQYNDNKAKIITERHDPLPLYCIKISEQPFDALHTNVLFEKVYYTARTITERHDPLPLNCIRVRE